MSPKKVGEILFDKMKIVDNPKKTETWQYITNEDILQQLKGKHVIVGKILKYREIDKLKYNDNKQRYSCCGYYEQKILHRNAANGFKKVVFTEI